MPAMGRIFAVAAVALGLILASGCGGSSSSKPAEPVRCVVPNVIGLILRDAKRKLRVRQCALGRVRRVRARRALYGRVIGQYPLPRKIKRKGFPVRVLIGRN